MSTRNDARTQTPHYEYVPIIDRPALELPGGARVAVLPYVNLEHFPHDLPGTAIIPGTQRFNPDPLNYGWRDYGNRVGLWRIVELMDECGMRGTVCLNSDVIREYPRIMEETLARNWAFMGHGMNNAPANFLSGIDEEREREIVSGVLDAIRVATGRRTKGWISPFLTHTNNTPRILAELGVEYLCDYTADDHPFPLRVPNGSLLAMPYSLELNDVPAFQNIGLSSEAFGDMIVDQFDVLYEEGASNARCMPICLHTFWVGQPNKFKHLRRAFEYIARHRDVWMATADEVNDWYRRNCMPA
ncbi:MAG: polysaccharide deacetylase [Burkholderiales bacterium]|nr:MAG: polysaccharide deacetylase [Burkholderiales bacterium]